MSKKDNGGASTSSLFITRIQVDELFGQYSYDLKPEADEKNLSRLLILYGENGTGKTTILWLLFHLLSRELQKGHRTYLAKSRFRRLAVKLGNGGELVAERSGTDLVGPFDMSYFSSTGNHHYRYITDDSGSIGSLTKDESHTAFTDALPDLNVKFLADDRKISTDLDLETRKENQVAIYWDESLVRGEANRVFAQGMQRAQVPPAQRWETALGSGTGPSPRRLSGIRKILTREWNLVCPTALRCLHLITRAELR